MRHYRSSIAWALLAVLGVGLFAGLGAWQWSRARWKENLLAAHAALLAGRVPQPLSLASDETRRDALDWSAGRGRFDGRVLLLDNQQRQGRAGVRVYRVFQPEQAQAPLLVELGWLPWGARRDVPQVQATAGEFAEVRGLLAPPPSPGLALGSGVQALGGNRWLLTRLDPPALAQIGFPMPLAPRVLKLDPALPLGYERDFDVMPNTLPPERHRGYAVQWFGLSATVAIVYLVLAVRAARRRKSAP